MCDSPDNAASAGSEKLNNTLADISLEQYNDWKARFRPLEQRVISEVEGLNDPGRIEQRVQTAQQDVSSQFTAARRADERRMASYGVNPSDGMFGSTERAYSLAEAGARAGAANRARDLSRTESLNAKMGLVQTGRGIANSAQAGLSTAASGLQSIGNQQSQQANANNQATGQAVGTAVAMAAAYFF